MPHLHRLVKWLLQRIGSAGATRPRSKMYIAISFRHNLHVLIPSILSSLYLSFFAFLWTLCTVCFSRSSLVEMSLGLDNSIIENLCGIRALPIFLQKNRVTRPAAVPNFPKS